VVPRQQRVGRNDESVADPAGDHAGESGDEATVDVGELGTVRGSLQDGDLVTERDDFGFEQPARLSVDDHQLDESDEQPVDERAETGTGWSVQARRHERGRLRPAILQGPARGGRSSFRHLHPIGRAVTRLGALSERSATQERYWTPSISQGPSWPSRTVVDPGQRVLLVTLTMPRRAPCAERTHPRTSEREPAEVLALTARRLWGEVCDTRCPATDLGRARALVARRQAIVY